MDTIGLDLKEMETFMVSLKEKLLGDREDTIRSNTKLFINQGCSQDEARFRANIIEVISIDTSIILGIIATNNQRILLDLKKTGLLGS